MTKATLVLDGFNEYMEELVRAGKDVDAVAGECLQAGGDVLVAGMRRRAPYERIRRSIRRTSIMRDGNKCYLYVGVLRDTDADMARICAVWEFGGRTSPSPRDRKRHPRPGIQARPYLRPALRQDAKKARTAMEDIFQRWLNP